MAVSALGSPFFARSCGDGVELVLRSVATTVEMHVLTMKNLERLRQWELWADLEPTLPATLAATQLRLDAFVRGAALPCAIRVDGVLVGGVELGIDLAVSTGELSCWLDADVEGRGIARLACAAVLDHAFASGLSRVEARIASGNGRSRRLAEHLGFVLEGTLRSAHEVGGVRQDVAVYGLVAEDRATRAADGSSLEVALSA
jgi:RimJ/RimL family protein N-acetyltransferase